MPGLCAPPAQRPGGREVGVDDLTHVGPRCVVVGERLEVDERPVEIEQYREEGRLLRVSAVIWVEREGQKAIVIGKQGELMKRIATKARESLEERFERKVFLEVFVKVKPKWRDAPGFMRTLDQHRYGVGAAEDESDEPAFFAGDEDLLEDEDNSLA